MLESLLNFIVDNGDVMAVIFIVLVTWIVVDGLHWLCGFLYRRSRPKGFAQYAAREVKPGDWRWEKVG